MLSDTIAKSEKFFSGISAQLPVTNRLKTVALTPEDEIECISFLTGTRVIIHQRVAHLIDEFLKEKRQRGTPLEQSLYKDMSRSQFIQRCIEKRPLVFMQSTDFTLLRDGTKYSNAVHHWKSLPQGNAAFSIRDYLTYDEIAISALIGVSSPTWFINNGSRTNRGICGPAGSFERFGIYVGLVGCRFEHLDEMESRFILKKDHLKEVEMPTYWKCIYESRCHKSGQERWLPIPRLGLSFDKLNYQNRLRITFDLLLHEAQSRSHEYGKPAYVHVVGLGLGVWQITEQQDILYVQEFIEALKDGNWNGISVVDFSWITPPSIFFSPSRVLCRSTGKMIDVKFSKRNPADLLPRNGSDVVSPYILIAAYAWDGNAFPGNEYWIGSMTASGDPAAACCSLIGELQNPLINCQFTSNIHVFESK